MDLHNMLHFYTPWIRQKIKKKKKKKKTDGDLLASNFSMIYLNFSMQVIKKEKFVT